MSDKWNDPYATVLGWIRCRLSFCLLHSAIQCIRGAQSSQGHYIKSAPVALVQSETQFLNCLTVYLYVLILFSLYLQKKKNGSDYPLYGEATWLESSINHLKHSLARAI